MAKILISFVGTGSLQQKEKQGHSYLASERQYKPATYHIDDDNIGEYPFVAAALTKYHNIDKVILVGTVHSMWEEVYKYFSEQNKIELDEDAFFEIAEHCDNATNESELVIPHKDKIEQAIGPDSSIMLIRYGLNEKEITDNIGIVLGLNDLINTGDELIVDVTHSFRSLPIFIMNLLLYLTNVSSKRPKISHIYYGMLEMSHTLNYAPIVDLKKILELNKWIVGASAFKNYGNAYMISELLQGVNTNLGNELKQFSDLLNLNHLDQIEKEVEKLKTMKNIEYNDPLPELTVKPVINDFLKKFGTTKGNHALFQYNLAKWQFDNMNYALALISLSEAILTYACMVAGRDWNDYDNREEIKGTIFDVLPKELAISFVNIKKYRNSVAHSLNSGTSQKKIIDVLRKGLDLAGKQINSHVWGTTR